MIVYLDMDGVLCDFMKRYKELFKDEPEETLSNNKKKELRKDQWKKFIDGYNFATLDFIDSAKILLDYLKDSGVWVEMLTSAGGKDHYERVREQKIVWLKAHGINYTPNVVVDGSLKAEFAIPDSILIDDTKRNIDQFNAAGGIGILHDQNDVYRTLRALARNGVV